MLTHILCMLSLVSLIYGNMNWAPVCMELAKCQVTLATMLELTPSAIYIYQEDIKVHVQIKEHITKNMSRKTGTPLCSSWAQCK